MAKNNHFFCTSDREEMKTEEISGHWAAVKINMDDDYDNKEEKNKKIDADNMLILLMIIIIINSGTSVCVCWCQCSIVLMIIELVLGRFTIESSLLLLSLFQFSIDHLEFILQFVSRLVNGPEQSSYWSDFHLLTKIEKSRWGWWWRRRNY